MSHSLSRIASATVSASTDTDSVDAASRSAQSAIACSAARVEARTQARLRAPGWPSSGNASGCASTMPRVRLSSSGWRPWSLGARWRITSARPNRLSPASGPVGESTHADEFGELPIRQPLRRRPGRCRRVDAVEE